MKCLDFSPIKINFRSCFKLKSSWYERAVIFAVLIEIACLLLFVRYGFVSLLLVLPYLLVVEKKVLISKQNNKSLTWRNFVLSARRYGRCLCVFMIRLLGLVFIYPFFSLTFSSFVLSDCEELDFKGVLILSNELSKGKRLKMFMYFLMLFSVCLSIIIVSFLILQLTSRLCAVPMNIYKMVLFGVGFFVVACFLVPMWRKYVEMLYLEQKTETIRKS